MTREAHEVGYDRRSDGERPIGRQASLADLALATRARRWAGAPSEPLTATGAVRAAYAPVLALTVALALRGPGSAHAGGHARGRAPAHQRSQRGTRALRDPEAGRRERAATWRPSGSSCRSRSWPCRGWRTPSPPVRTVRLCRLSPGFSWRRSRGSSWSVRLSRRPPGGGGMRSLLLASGCGRWPRPRFWPAPRAATVAPAAEHAPGGAVLWAAGGLARARRAGVTVVHLDS